MKILLAGASGLIGTEIKRQATGQHEIRSLVRREPNSDEFGWDPARGELPTEAISWADAVISLSGASLSRLPWTTSYRAEILQSRTSATNTIATAIRDSDAPPAVWVSGSAVGFYGDRPDEALTEDSARGSGYLADVVSAWEAATAPADTATRIVHARTGLVLAPGGALKPLRLTTNLGLGARVGRGSQHWPWIALVDEAAALIHLATASTLAGPVNLVAPGAATSEEVTRALAFAMHRPHVFALPSFALRAGMGLAADELLLADQCVVRSRLLADGFSFAHPDVDAAVIAAMAA